MGVWHIKIIGDDVEIIEGVANERPEKKDDAKPEDPPKRKIVKKIKRGRPNKKVRKR